MRMPMLVAMPFLLLTPSPVIQTDMYNGRPVFAEGVELGYFIWRDGDTWNVRWTTMGRMRVFTGSVTGVGGKLKSLKRIDVETERKVISPGRRTSLVVVGPSGGRTPMRGSRSAVGATKAQGHTEMLGDDRIVFSARTDDDVDGFSFKVADDVRRLEFNLSVGGRSLPGIVEVGRNNHKPSELPLIVIIK